MIFDVLLICCPDPGKGVIHHISCITELNLTQLLTSIFQRFHSRPGNRKKANFRKISPWGIPQRSWANRSRLLRWEDQRKERRQERRRNRLNLAVIHKQGWADTNPNPNRFAEYPLYGRFGRIRIPSMANPNTILLINLLTFVKNDDLVSRQS